MKFVVKEKQAIFFRIALAVLLIWLIVSLVQLQIEISAKASELTDLQTQIAVQTRINEELATESANDDIYLEQQARNKGLAKPGESIYKEIPGN